MDMELREPAIAYGKQKFTVEEYLAMETAAVEKHEYYRGEIFAMSRPKVPHIGFQGICLLRCIKS